MVEFSYFCKIKGKDMALTIKQEKFCGYYIECGNASEAYRRAFSCGKMKPETVNRTAFELLENRKISARIAELRTQMQQRSDFTRDEALRILADIARVNMSDVLVTKTSKNFTTIAVKDLSSLPLSVQRAVMSVKSTRDGYELKLYNKIDAIERISKMLGWDEAVKADVNATIGGGLTINHAYTGYKPATSEEEVREREGGNV